LSELRLRKLIVSSLAGIILLIALYNLWAYQGTLLASLIKDSPTDNPHRPIESVFKENGISDRTEVWLEIVKSKNTLTVYSAQRAIKTYQVALGKDYLEKQKAGDKRTPAGEYMITGKKVFSPPKRFLGSYVLQLNYPNTQDALRGLKQGLITGSDFLAIEQANENKSTPPQDTSLGGGIYIHGGGGPFMGSSWTGGSIALYSKDAGELFGIVDAGTRVIIRM